MLIYKNLYKNLELENFEKISKPNQKQGTNKKMILNLNYICYNYNRKDVKKC